MFNLDLDFLWVTQRAMESRVQIIQVADGYLLLSLSMWHDIQAKSW